MRKQRTGKSRKPLFIAIIGGSGSGKSWMAGLLAKMFGRNAVRLNVDSFYRDRSHLSPGRRARLNFDHPRAIDWPALERALCDLSLGKAALIPFYDFSTHCRSGQSLVKPRDVIILDGLWLVHRRFLRRFMDLVVFMDCPSSTRLARRLKRDVRDRGRTPQSIKTQFEETVEPMHRRYVEQQKAFANIVVTPGKSNMVARRIARWVSVERKAAENTRNKTME